MLPDEYEIIDAHFHLFRDISHEKTGIQRSPPPRDIDRIGTVEKLIPYMEREGISKIVFVNWIASREFIEAALRKLPPDLGNPERAAAEELIKQDMQGRVRRHNDWVIEVGRKFKQLVPFIGVQPILGPGGMAEEAKVRWQQGTKGVKIIPAVHQFFPYDKQMWPFYETCQDLGIPVISDSGPLLIYGEKQPFGQPAFFAEVLRNFPRLTLVLAHLGHAFWDERIELAKQFPNVYFDTAQGFSTPMSVAIHGYRGLSAADAPRVIRKIGIERVIFGSDAPRSFDPVSAAEEILTLDLTDDEKKMILAENAKRIYRI